MGLDEMLKAGPLPPRAGLELAVGLVDRLVGQPALGPDVLNTRRVFIDADGNIDIDRRGAGPANDTQARQAFGAVLYEALVGMAWSTDPGAYKLQLDEARAQLAFWPDGESVANFLVELLQPGAKGISGVRSRAAALQVAAAGPSLLSWRDEVVMRLDDAPAPAGNYHMAVDDLTANFPAGFLASKQEAAAAAAAAAHASSAPVLHGTPPPAPDKVNAERAAARRNGRNAFIAVQLVFLLVTGVLLLVVAALLIAFLMS